MVKPREPNQRTRQRRSFEIPSVHVLVFRVQFDGLGKTAMHPYKFVHKVPETVVSTKELFFEESMVQYNGGSDYSWLMPLLNAGTGTERDQVIRAFVCERKLPVIDCRQLVVQDGQEFLLNGGRDLGSRGMAPSHRLSPWENFEALSAIFGGCRSIQYLDHIY